MFERSKATAIGKVMIKDLSALDTWLNTKDGKNYINYNWSEAKAGAEWETHEQINFYELQTIIPFYNESVYLFDSSYALKDLKNECEYFATIGQKFDLLYYDKNKKYAVFCSNKNVYLLPELFLDIYEHKNYDEFTVSQMQALTGDIISENTVMNLSDTSVHNLKDKLQDKQDSIHKTEQEIETLKEEQEAKIEAFKKELELMYQDKFAMIQKKQEELMQMKKSLENQLYVLESEIYAIRCYNGEVINFTQITSGEKEKDSTPVILYQKVRYLDEEMGKYLALYNFDGEDISQFENVLKYREDLRDLFAPKDKSVSFVKVSKTGTIYSNSEEVANMLTKYEKIHGNTIAIIVRNGGNVWIGWTDEEKISLNDGNVFYKPQTTRVEKEDEDLDFSTSKESMVSRYFIFAILQGICDAQQMINLPQKISVTKPNPYIIFSMADGWLEDNRFGTFEEIVNRTNLELKKDDTILTTIRITRDDIYEKTCQNSINKAYNNNRGRGDKNRTHDVALSNCTLYPINLVDRFDTYMVYVRRYSLNVIETKTYQGESKYGGQIYSINYAYESTGEEPIIKSHRLVLENYDLNNRGYKLKGLTPLEIYHAIKGDNMFSIGQNQIETHYNNNTTGYVEEFDHIEFDHTDYKYFVSAEKGDKWNPTTARVNMEIYKEEILNLTFLNTIWVKYAIMNQKMGSWKIAYQTVDYAKSIQYLNTALEYLKKREEEEEALLTSYGELPNEWQVLLSEWKIQNDIHRLTNTRAKKFMKILEYSK